MPPHHSRCRSAHQGSSLPIPTLAPYIPHCTPELGTVPHLLPLLARASPLSLPSLVVEACLETQQVVVSLGPCVWSLFVLGGFCGSSPQAAAARFRPVFAFLSQASSSWPTLPTHPSRHRPPRAKPRVLCVISRLDLGHLEISWSGRWGDAVPAHAGLQLLKLGAASPWLQIPVVPSTSSLNVSSPPLHTNLHEG